VASTNQESLTSGVTRERVLQSFKDPDCPVDVPSEEVLSAYPYGPANIPIQHDVAALMKAGPDAAL
jgi:ATP-dependent DNA helicase 2 subunit 2